MRAVTLWPFFVERGGHVYEVGEAFDGPDATVARLAARGLVRPQEAEASADKPDSEQVTDEGGNGPKNDATGGEADLSALTVAQLRALADARGVSVPRKATKARLLAALSE